MAAKKMVTIETRKKATEALLALPAKLPASETVEEALRAMKPALESLLKKGYSREEVVQQLVEQGIPAKLYHLKTLLSVKSKKTN